MTTTGTARQILDSVLAPLLFSRLLDESYSRVYIPRNFPIDVEFDSLAFPSESHEANAFDEVSSSLHHNRGVIETSLKEFEEVRCESGGVHTAIDPVLVERRSAPAVICDGDVRMSLLERH